MSLLASRERLQNNGIVWPACARARGQVFNTPSLQSVICASVAGQSPTERRVVPRSERRWDPVGTRSSFGKDQTWNASKWSERRDDATSDDV